MSMVRQFDRLTVLSKAEGQAHHRKEFPPHPPCDWVTFSLTRSRAFMALANKLHNRLSR